MVSKLRTTTLFPILLIAAASLPVQAQEYEPVILTLNFGNFGFGTNVPFNNSKANAEIAVTLINFGFEHKNSNFGMEFSPYHAVGWFGSGEPGTNDTMIHSFLNFKLFWNVLSLERSRFYMGPFCSVNYLFVRDIFYWDRYIFTAGLHSGFRARGEKIGYNIFSVETGYRIIDGKGRFFAGLKIDIPILMLLLILAD